MSGDQAGEVRHVDEEFGAYLVCDLAHAGEVELAGVGGAAADEDFGLDFDGLLLECVVVDDLGVLPNLVAGDVVELAGEIELVAVGEMAAIGEIEPKDGVPGLNQRHEGGGVGLGAGVRLHVGVLGAKELFGAVAGKVLNYIGVLAAAVIALARVAFGVLVGEDGPHGLKHGARDEVFTGNHLQAFMLAEHFILDLLGHLRIGSGERRV